MWYQLRSHKTVLKYSSCIAKRNAQGWTSTETRPSAVILLHKDQVKSRVPAPEFSWAVSSDAIKSRNPVFWAEWENVKGASTLYYQPAKQSKDLPPGFQRDWLRSEKVLESAYRLEGGNAKTGGMLCSPNFYSRDLPLLSKPATLGKASDQHSLWRYKRNRPHGLHPAGANNTVTETKAHEGILEMQSIWNILS